MGLVAACRFLTIMPLGRADSPLAGVNWFPVVGIALGGLLAAVAWAAGEAWGPGLMLAAVVVTAWVIATGGLHLDGLADSADAGFAPVSPERRLEILRDVHHGTFAIVALMLVLLLKVSALATLGAREAAATAAAATITGRALLPLAIGRFPSMPGSRMAASVRSEVKSAGMVAGGALGLAAASFCLGLEGLAAIAGAWAAGSLALWWLSNRFGGVGGDALGAFVETTETAFLLGAAVFAHHQQLEPFPWP